jgi:hypothetical protein
MEQSRIEIIKLCPLIKPLKNIIFLYWNPVELKFSDISSDGYFKFIINGHDVKLTLSSGGSSIVYLPMTKNTYYFKTKHLNPKVELNFWALFISDKGKKQFEIRDDFLFFKDDNFSCKWEKEIYKTCKSCGHKDNIRWFLYDHYNFYCSKECQKKS